MLLRIHIRILIAITVILSMAVLVCIGLSHRSGSSTPVFPNERNTQVEHGTATTVDNSPSRSDDESGHSLLSPTMNDTQGDTRQSEIPTADGGGKLSRDPTALLMLLNKHGESEMLRNNAANKLRDLGEPTLVKNLTEMLRDEKETPKWRNYCVQQLYFSYVTAPNPSIVDTFFKASSCDEKMVRICAVWSLALVATPGDKSKTPDAETLKKIQAIALAALREKDTHFLITEAGVQSCARLGLTEALPDIRALASSDQTKPEHLRIVSVAALGDLKDTESTPLLERLSKEATGQLQSAAQLALKRINEAKAQDKIRESPESKRPEDKF